MKSHPVRTPELQPWPNDFRRPDPEFIAGKTDVRADQSLVLGEPRVKNVVGVDNIRSMGTIHKQLPITSAAQARDPNTAVKDGVLREKVLKIKRVFLIHLEKEFSPVQSSGAPPRI